MYSLNFRLIQWHVLYYKYIKNFFFFYECCVIHVNYSNTPNVARNSILPFLCYVTYVVVQYSMSYVMYCM